MSRMGSLIVRWKCPAAGVLAAALKGRGNGQFALCTKSSFTNMHGF